MKKQIRVGVFETNSSMTHALTICTQEEYDKWQNGETLFDRWGNKNFIISDDERIAKLKKEYEDDNHNKYYDTFEEFLADNGIFSYDEYSNDYYFEHFHEPFTTPSGDEMVAFGYYGHD